MADTTALKNRIRAAIKANDNQEITGPVLQQALLDVVDELNLYPELQEAINNEANARQNAVAEIAGRLDIFSGFTFNGGGNQTIVRIGAFKQGQKIFVTVDSLEFDGTLNMQIYDFTNNRIVSSFSSNGTYEINFSADSDNIAFVINVNSANTYYRGYVIARSRKISTTLAPNIIEPPTTNAVYNGINAVSKAEELYNGIHFVGGGQQILYELGDFKAGAYFGVDISNIKRNGSYNIQLVSLKTYEMFIGPYSSIADTFLSTTLNNDVERLAVAINVSQDNTYISGDIKVSRSLPKRELKTLTSGGEYRIEKGVFRCLYIEPTGIGNFKVSLYSGGSLISKYTFSSYRKSTQYISLDNCDLIKFINTEANDAQFFYSLEESHKIKFLREDVDKLSMIDYYGMASPLYRSVVALPSSNTIATYENMVAKTGGIIRSICIKPFNEGTFTFGLGTIDQRNWPIIRDTFNVNIPSTDFQTIDLISREIKVKKGEYLFVYNEKNDSENIGFLANVDNIDMCPNMLYGTEGGVTPFPKDGTTNFGAVLGLINWYIIPQNEGIDNSDKDNEIELNRRITNASFGGTHIIRDNDGNAYKITKDNNNILLSEVKYKKVLILGNSLLTGLNGHGLCATISSNDFANILLKAFLLKDNTSTISRLNAAPWERTLGVTQQDFDTLFNGYTDNYDLVIIRIGENVNNVLQLRDSMDALIEYISTKYANADIVVTSTVLDYSNYNKNAALLESSLAHGIPFVNIDGSKDKYLIGIAKMYTNGNVIRPSYYAIQTHSNDLGFLHIANSILSTIGYNTINISHNIVTNSSIKADVPQLGVENGIVTIKTYGLSAPTIVVTDANNNSLSVTHYNLSDFEFDRRFTDGTEDTATFSSTFIMPNTDVSISVS